MKLTGWYRGDQKPVRIGVYEREGQVRNYYSYWNGVFWGALIGNPEDAVYAAEHKSWAQNYPWRGVAK